MVVAFTVLCGRERLLCLTTRRQSWGQFPTSFRHPEQTKESNRSSSADSAPQFGQMPVKPVLIVSLVLLVRQVLPL